MNLQKFRSKFNNPIVQKLSSLKLTVICLFILALLVLLGTLDQVENGLYLAQEKFFNSVFIFYGPLPIPSARVIMWILFLNLIFALVFRFNYSFKNSGLIISHLGLVVLLISGFITFNFSTESFISLIEGESKNISSDYMKWELVILKEDPENAIKFIFKDSELKTGAELKDANLGCNLKIKMHHINSQLFDTPFAGQILKEMPRELEYEKNVKALVLELDFGDELIEAELQGESKQSYSFKHKDNEYLLVLRKKQYNLPFSIELIDVVRELHPGTDKPKSYHSKVIVHEDDIDRELTISMNKPFRSGLYTAYQASYGQDPDGRELTVLAVVKNLSYALPYVGSLLTSLGLFIHFIQMFLNHGLKVAKDD